MKEIVDAKGIKIKVDLDDYDWLNKYSWFTKQDGRTFYAYTNLKTETGRKITSIHSLIIGKPPKGFQTDHIDGDGLNNQRSNLRIVTIRQNAQNRHQKRKKASIYPGVCWNKPNKYRGGSWCSFIKINEKRLYLGSFPTEKEAFVAYCKALESIGEVLIDHYD